MNYFRCGGGRSTHTATKIDVAKTPLATFQSNVSGLYLPEILAYIQATQSGTGDPSPFNPRAIIGVSSVDTTVCGVNLCPNVNINDTVNAVALSTDTDGIVTLNGTASNSVNVPAALFFLKAGSYIFSDNVEGTFPNNASARSQIMDSNNSLIVGILNNQSATKQTSFTLSEDTHIYVRFRLNGGSTYSSCRIKPMIRSSGVTDSTFDAYTGTTATTALGGTYYGGYVNVTTGLMTVTQGMINISAINWTGATSNPPVFRGVLSSIPNVQIPPNNAVPTTAITEAFTAYAYSPLSSSSIGKFAISDTGSNRIVFIDNSVNSLGAFLQAHGSEKLIYPLATPQTVQLTPAQLAQLLGQNNVFCSTGDVAVKGWKID